MHSLVRRFIRTAIAYLIVGLALGVWMIVQRDLIGTYPSPYLTSAHTHAILVGFVMMMILGVALWLFPRPDREDRLYRPGLVSLAYWLLTAGTGARVAGEVARPFTDAVWLRGGIVASGVAQALGIVVFFVTMWHRVRPAGSQVREGRGERF